MKMSTKRLAVLGMLSALSLIIFIIELRLPSLIPIPGVKPGLSNIVVLVALFAYDRKSAAAVLFVKTVLGAVFAGSMLRFLYSFAGSVCCFAVAAALRGAVRDKQIWFLSAVAACAHNFGQLLTARLVLGTAQIWWYAPILALSGVATGVFTGLCVGFALPVLRKAERKRDSAHREEKKE